MSQSCFAILCLFLLDFRACNRGSKGPLKPKTYCDNGRLRSYPSHSVFTFRSGPVWRQDLAILSPEGLRNNTCQLRVSSKAKGPGEKGAPGDHPETSSQKLANFECRFPYDSYGRDRAPFCPFQEKDFWAISGGPLFSWPLCSTADLNGAHARWYTQETAGSFLRSFTVFCCFALLARTVQRLGKAVLQFSVVFCSFSLFPTRAIKCIP